MIYLHNLKKQFGSKILFNDIGFHLRPREKVGLVGENGMGKTTLFKVITGKESLDSGEVVMKKGIQAAMLAQELETADESVLERTLAGDEKLHRIKLEMDRLEKDTAFHERCPEEWSRKYGHLQHEFEHMGGYQRESQGRAILQGLGFRTDQADQPLAKFSGGWRMRVELARLLLQKPDLLLLDEPTNHLDLQSVVWLEGFLKAYEGAILLISHDRRFLNGLVERIVELDRGRLTVYTGNYDAFERQKAEREAQLEAQAANQMRRIAEIERFVERFRAKNTKATQVQSRIKLLDKMERVETATRTKSVHFRFPQPARTGRIAIRLTDVDKNYGPLKVYEKFSTHLERGWKVALVGENGAGKSTLLKLMAGILPHDGGDIELGANVTRAYYAQHHADVLDPSLTVLESLEKAAPHLLRTQRQNILGAFLFSGDDVEKRVSVLSGGERSRLALARILANPATFLLLDEPTNHLDIRTCEFLAAALADFEGSLALISHDRFFLDGIINRVWEVRGGTVREYVGNYSDYEWAKAKEAEQAAPSASVVKDNAGNPARLDRERKRREAEERNERYRKIKPLQDRLRRTEERLERVMADKAQVELALADPILYQEDHKTRLHETLIRQTGLVKEETNLIHEWDQLTATLEKLENQNG
ncbi:MAG: ABC transporter ATP-binding protein [Nitrospinae bacterium CG11_big_fil_rev_8_21_14_0_20_56_8]|nr:MAG: ABC transporter ATP-binding protein [Nitrospinae bacterium CG11_big_fil_rev_8_21_14_0_20_56_8]